MRGTADVVTDDAVAALEETDLHPWADGVDQPRWIRVEPTGISGRRIPNRQAAG